MAKYQYKNNGPSAEDRALDVFVCHLTGKSLGLRKTHFNGPKIYQAGNITV